MNTGHKTNLFALLHLISFPVKLASHILHIIIPHDRNVSRFIIGGLVVLVGSFLSSLEQHLVPRFLWDGLAWLIHGIGSAPIIEYILKSIAKD